MIEPCVGSIHGTLVATRPDGRRGRVWIASEGRRGNRLNRDDDGFLLGVSSRSWLFGPTRRGRIGQALVGRVAERVFAKRRWLFVSCDGSNVAALRFYRRLGFSRVGSSDWSGKAGSAPAPETGGAAPFTKVEAGPPEVGYHWGRS